MGSKLKFSGVLLTVVATAVVLAEVRTGGLGKRDLIIAIVDTGFDAKAEPGLVKRLLPGKNFFDGNDDTTDLANHGTRVTLTAATACPDCRFLPIKVTKSGGATRADDLARAIRFALENRARVINISMGVTQGSDELQKAVSAASQVGAIIVAAAGVGVPNPFRPMLLDLLYPQAYDDVIVVGASGTAERSDDLTNFGDRLDFSVVIQGGSSFAAGQVSGEIGRRLLTDLKLDAPGLRQLLRASTRAPAPRSLDRIGYGFFDSTLFRQGQPADVGARVYRDAEGVGIDFNARAEIQTVGAVWNCPGEGKTAQTMNLRQNSVRKGRAHLVLDPPPKGDCVIEARAVLAGGMVRDLTLR